MLWGNIGHRLGDVWPLPDVTQQSQMRKTDERKKGGTVMIEKRKRRALIKPHGFIHPSVASAAQCHSLTADGGETMRSTVAHVSADSNGEGGTENVMIVCSSAVM